MAGTDHERRLVSPLKTLLRKKWAQDVASLREIIDARDVIALVVGLPLDMDGTFGPAAQSARDSSQRLANEVRLPILLQDERLTTEAVRQAIDEGRLSKPKDKNILDAYAAAVILQDTLSAMAQSTKQNFTAS